jgi:hypothetical protein
LLTVLLLVCGGLVGGGLYYAGAFGPRWQSFDVPGGGCRVDVPAAPALQPAAAQPGVANLTTYSAHRLMPAQEFGVGYFDVPGGEPGPQALDDGLTGMVRSLPGMTERTRGPATLGELIGKQVIADGPSRTVVARIAPAGNRYYVLLVSGRGLAPDDANVAHFFDSFQVTDVARLAWARARERAAAESKAAAEQWRSEQKARQERDRQEALAKAEAARKDYEQFERSGHLGREVPDGATLAGVKMYLPFGPDGGAEVRNAVDGQVYGAIKEPARLGAGVRGTGLHLPAAYAALYLPDTDGVQFGPDDPFTVAGWFRARDANGDVLRVGTWGAIGSTDQLVVELRQGNVRVTLWAPKLDPKVPFLTPAAAMTAPWPGDDGWHHFAIVRTPRGDGEVVEFYFDGVRAAQQFRGRRTDLYAAKALTLGGERPGSSSGRFRGGIDEVYSFSRALAEADVRRLAGLPAEATPRPQAASPADLPGLVFHLPFDDTDGRQVTEAVTKKPVGRVKGTIEIVDGVRGRAARLTPHGGSGISSAALALAEEKGKFEFAAGAPFTVATWVRAQAGQNAYLVSNTNFQFTVYQKSVSVQLRSPARGAAFQSGVTLQGPRPDGWCHVALTRAADGELTLYVNGQPAKQLGKPPTMPDPIQMAPGYEFGLAVSSWGREQCDLDEFCIYNRALTADELRKLGARPDGLPGEKGKLK